MSIYDENDDDDDEWIKDVVQRKSKAGRHLREDETIWRSFIFCAVLRIQDTHNFTQRARPQKSL
jgi:hypothetical protein